MYIILIICKRFVKFYIWVFVDDKKIIYIELLLKFMYVLIYWFWSLWYCIICYYCIYDIYRFLIVDIIKLSLLKYLWEKNI